MKFLNVKFLVILVSTAIGLNIIETNAAQAASFTSQIINIQANNPHNSITLDLSAGEYAVNYIGIADGGIYDGWNAWGTQVNNVSGCDLAGKQCQIGWGNGYFISLNNGPDAYFGYGNGKFSTVSLARENSALSNTSFTLLDNGTAKFFIPDSYYPDNLGGVSLKIEKKSVPEPFTTSGILLVGSIGLLLKKKK